MAERRGDAGDAISILRNLLQRNPDYSPAHEALGGLFLKQKQYFEAQQELQKAVLLNPGSARAHYQLGMLFGRIGRTEESHEQIELAQKLESEDRAKNELQLHILMPE